MTQAVLPFCLCFCMQALLKRLESVKPSKGITRSEQFADYQRQARYICTPLPTATIEHYHSKIASLSASSQGVSWRKCLCCCQCAHVVCVNLCSSLISYCAFTCLYPHREEHQAKQRRRPSQPQTRVSPFPSPHQTQPEHHPSACLVLRLRGHRPDIHWVR